MRTLVLFLFFSLILSGCTEKWEKRYKEEAKSKCDCLKEYRETITPALQHLYDTAANFRYTNSRIIDSEHIAMIRLLRNSLSAKEEAWSQRLGKEFMDEDSRLSKCWHKRFEWSDEHPGNNWKYTPSDYAREMGCDLVDDLPTITLSDQLREAIFE